MADDYFDAKLALNRDTGSVVPGAVAQVYAIQDTTFSAPLALTDMSGVPMAALVASPTGIYPEFRVVSGEQDVIAKSGSMFTPITSKEGSRGEPGEEGKAGIGLPDAGSLPDGYVPITASGEWAIAPAGAGSGGGGSSSIFPVDWVDGVGWPAMPLTPPAGVKSRWFIGGPSEYTGPVWPGVRDLYIRPNV